MPWLLLRTTKHVEASGPPRVYLLLSWVVKVSMGRSLVSPQVWRDPERAVEDSRTRQLPGCCHGSVVLAEVASRLQRRKESRGSGGL